MNTTPCKKKLKLKEKKSQSLSKHMLPLLQKIMISKSVCASPWRLETIMAGAAKTKREHVHWSVGLTHLCQERAVHPLGRVIFKVQRHD